MQRLIVAVALMLALAFAGCATAPPPARETPPLRLAPALLGHPLDLQQHLTLQAPGHDRQLDVLLEADERHVQLGVLAAGQVAARLDWDGVTLTESKAPWWPQAVSGSRILSDLQLTLWPAAAIQAALPAGWRLVEDGNVRTLTQDGDVVTVITRHLSSSCAQSQDPACPGTTVTLAQRRDHFTLKIESRDLSGAATPVNP